jgi:ammonium transporter Rh
MIFIGYGFIMVFLKSYSWSSIGFNFLTASWAIQIAILWNHFWTEVSRYYDDRDKYQFQYLNLNIRTILEGDFCAASALITFGAILGKCSIFQLFGIASFHAFFYTLNKAICEQIFKAQDAGEA